MASRFLFVLRGRPGLGHVIPGYALATVLAERGHDVRLVTYGNGLGFLERSGWRAVETAPVRGAYEDWPGLRLYDHGVGFLAPRIERFEPNVVVLGGEYLLAPLSRVVDAPCGMLYNPEIFEATPRNHLPARLFVSLFEHCDFLVPLQPPSEAPRVPQAEALRDREWASGPFAIPLATTRRSSALPSAGSEHGLLVLIANGGGVDFPRRSASYSSRCGSTRRWVAATRENTRLSVVAALAAARDSDRVVVYSCLGPARNEALRREFAHDERVRILPPSTGYYCALRRADVVISRAGLGCIHDVRGTNAAAVLWHLSNHDEQEQNAARLARERERVWVADDEAVLRESVPQAIDAARKPATQPTARREHQAAHRRTVATANRLQRAGAISAAGACTVGGAVLG